MPAVAPQQARDPEGTGQTAAFRRRCLSELEEREPEAFARWLAAGPDHDPAQFVTLGPDEHSGPCNSDTTRR